MYGYADGDPINKSDPFGLCPGCAAFGVSVVATMAGPGFDNLNPAGYVVSNPAVRLNTVALHANLAEHHSAPGFEFQVTGGDRYETTASYDDGNGGGWTAIQHRSRTNNSVIGASSATSPHLESRGARAVDLRIKGVASSTVDDAISKTGFAPGNTSRDYPTAPHTHVALPPPRP